MSLRPFGQSVKVWPHPGVRVRSHGPELPDRHLDEKGQDLPWSPHLEAMHGQGLIHLTDPAARCSPEDARKLQEADTKRVPAPTPSTET